MTDNSLVVHELKVNLPADVKPEYNTMLAKWKNLDGLTKSEPERYMPDGTCKWILGHFMSGKILHGDIYPPTTARIRAAKRNARPKINQNRRKK